MDFERDPITRVEVKILKSNFERLEKDLACISKELQQTRLENLRFRTYVMVTAIVAAGLVMNVIIVRYL